MVNSAHAPGSDLSRVNLIGIQRLFSSGSSFQTCATQTVREARTKLSARFVAQLDFRTPATFERRAACKIVAARLTLKVTLQANVYGVAQNFKDATHLTSTHFRRVLFDGFFDPYTSDATFVSFKNFNLKSTDRESLTNGWNFAGLVNNQSGYRSEIVGLNLHIEKSFDLSDLSRSENFVVSFADIKNFFQLVAGYILVLNLPDDLFQDVFNGNQPADASVLIDHHRQLYVCLLHFLEQFSHWFCLGHKIDLAD